MKPINLGIIGFGVIGKAHHRSVMELPDKFNLVAVADLRDVARHEAAAAGVETVYCSDEELLADRNIEAVVTAMPTGVRDPVVLKALKAGKHVLFEKPPAMNAATIERYMALRGGLTVGCCSARTAFGPSVAAAAKFIADGSLGQVRLVRIRATSGAGKPPAKSPPPWRQSFALNGGGILVNWGIYDLNYVLELTGWRLTPKSVFAQTWPVADVFADRVATCADADSHFIALIRCAGGEAITFERGEFMAARTEEQWQIVGSKASLTMAMHAGNDNRILVDEANPGEGVVSRTLWQGDDTLAKSALHEDFAAAIREGRPPRTGLERALVMQKIFDGIYASARDGNAVEIS